MKTGLIRTTIPKEHTNNNLVNDIAYVLQQSEIEWMKLDDEDNNDVSQNVHVYQAEKVLDFINRYHDRR